MCTIPHSIDKDINCAVLCRNNTSCDPPSFLGVCMHCTAIVNVITKFQKYLLKKFRDGLRIELIFSACNDGTRVRYDCINHCQVVMSISAVIKDFFFTFVFIHLQ